MANHFCAGIGFKKIEGIWYVPAIKAKGRTNAKMIGGCGEDTESDEDTLLREAHDEESEGTLIPESYIEVSIEPLSNHRKIYYLFDKFSLKIKVGELVVVDEDDGDQLEFSLWKLQEFVDHLFSGHKDGFTYAITKMAELDPIFKEENLQIIEKLKSEYLEKHPIKVV